MSDSEEDAFQSADEGDKGENPSGPKVDTCKDVVQERASPEKPAVEKPSEVKPKEKAEAANEKQKGKKGKQRRKNKSSSNTAHNVDKSSEKDAESETLKSEVPQSLNTSKSEGKSSDIPPDESVEKNKTDNVENESVDVARNKIDQPEETKEPTAIVGCKEEDNVEEKDVDDKTEESEEKLSGDGEQVDTTQKETNEKESEEKPSQTPSEKTESTASDNSASGWGSWGSWGKSLGTSLLSTATKSVGTFSHQVGEGLHTVMEVVDGSLGAVPPEEMVKIQMKASEIVETDVVLDKEGHEVQGEAATVQGEVAEKDVVPPETESEDKDYNVSSTGGWFSAWGVTSLTQAVKTTVDTSKHLMEGSLDVLETIGKKTVDVLKENDPGFSKTKSLLQGKEKQSLSELLQTAKIEAEEKAKEQQEMEKAQTASFSLLFDEYQGLALLEALEMLSQQCEPKVNNLIEALPSELTDDAKKKLDDIEEKFNIEDVDDVEDGTEHEFVKLVTNHLADVHLGTAPDKLNQAHLHTREWLSKCFLEQAAGTVMEPQELHEKALRSLAEVTAKCVEQFHKAGELILLQRDNGKDMLSRAENLACLTRVVCTEIQILSNKFTACLTTAADDAEDPDEVNPLLTDVYLEATNSNQYIMDAFKLLLPVLQQASLESLVASNSL